MSVEYPFDVAGPMLVDSHCHLDFPDFTEELEDIVTRASDNGVGTALTISTKFSTFPNVLAVARRYSHIYASVGVHPHEVEQEAGDDDTPRLIKLAADPDVIAIGETGLDYFYEHSPREQQQTAFRAHIAACRETRLPLIVHTRDAEADTVSILKDEMDQGEFPLVIHCFSGSDDLAKKCLDLGATLSFSGILTFKKAEELRDIAKSAPMDRILVETDAPYLAPVPKRGKRNEPAFVAHTAACLAEVRGVSLTAIAEATTTNFFNLFTKAKPPQ